ncbi:MAG: hypothetical protein HN337_02545 [Deltaproteobacteria bacterium]|jgi:hypothetical protein|nr:hypothetical protein [Deltaproteobacteria bacterium]
MSKRFFTVLLLAIIILTIPSKSKASNIDKEWPAIQQYLVAVSELYPKDNNAMKGAAFALASSKFVAKDAHTIGICKKWINSSSNCIDGEDPLIQKTACQNMEKHLDAMYLTLLKNGSNVSTDSEKFTNAHVLAAYVIEEFLYKLNMDGFAMLLTDGFCDALSDQAALTIGLSVGDPGKAGGPNGASGNAPSNSNGSSCSVLGDTQINPYGPDPAPMTSPSGPVGGGQEPVSPIGPNAIGHQMGGPNPCPINFTAAGGGKGVGDNEYSLSDGLKEPNWDDFNLDIPDDRSKDNGNDLDNETGSRENDNNNSNANDGGSDHQNSGSGPTITKIDGGSSGIITWETIAGGWVAGNGVVGMYGGHNFGSEERPFVVGWIASISGGGEYSGGGGIGGTFTTSPDADISPGICNIGPTASLCLSTESAEEKCEKKKMEYCMVANCTEEYLNSDCGGGDGAGALDLTQMPGYGNIDPLPEDVNPTPPDDDPCGGPAPYTGKPSKECCDEKPNNPGCGDPTGMNTNTLISNPGIQSPAINKGMRRNLRKPTFNQSFTE